MSAAPDFRRSRWSDDRIDDMHDDVKKLLPLLENVAALTVEVRSLTEAIKESRSGKTQFKVAIWAAVVGALASGIVIALTQSPHPFH